MPYSPQVGFSCQIYNCLYCAYNNTCSTCVVGYQLINGLCAVKNGCPANCSMCTNSSYCITCSSGYFLSQSNQCIVKCNINNCAQCNSTNSCMTCNGNYSLSASGNACQCLYPYQQTSSNCLYIPPQQQNDTLALSLGLGIPLLVISKY